MAAARRPSDGSLALVWIIAVSLAARVLLAAVTGLSVDEAYVVAMARQPGLAYFDHPPLTMWIVHAVMALTGSEASFALRIPTLLFFCGTIWFTWRVAARLFSQRAGVWAAAALAVAPLFGGYFGTMLVTDGPALFFAMLSVDLLSRVLFSGSGRIDWPVWLCLGVAFGLALMSKYTVGLLVPGLLVFLLTSPAQRRWLATPAPYVAALVAVAILSPALYWNATHHWAGFQFQGHRAYLDGQIHPVRALGRLGILSLTLLPTIWLGIAIAIFQAFHRGLAEPRSGLLAWLAVGPVVFFPLIWLIGGQTELGFQWASPGYLVAFPLLGAAIDRWNRTYRAPIRLLALGSLAATVVVMTVYLSDFVLGWFPVLTNTTDVADDMIVDQIDWWGLRQTVQTGALGGPVSFVIGGSWKDCVKAARVTGDIRPIYCVTDFPVAPAFIERGTFPIGSDAIVVLNAWSADQARAALQPYFATFEPLPAVAVTTFGRTVMTLKLMRAHDLVAPLPGTAGAAPARPRQSNWPPRQRARVR